MADLPDGAYIADGPPITSSEDYREFLAECGYPLDDAQALLEQLWAISLDHSDYEGRLDEAVPEDILEWKKSRRQLKKIADGLSKYESQLASVGSYYNRVMMHMLDETDPEWVAMWGDLQDVLTLLTKLQVLMPRLNRLAATMEAASRLDGTSGNAQNPDWHVMAVVLCREEWSRVGNPQERFYLASGRRAGNEFTEWLVRTLKEVGMSAGEVETACTKLNAVASESGTG